MFRVNRGYDVRPRRSPSLPAGVDAAVDARSGARGD